MEGGDEWRAGRLGTRVATVSAQRPNHHPLTPHPIDGNVVAVLAF